MSQKNRATFAKRERELERVQRAAEKRQRRQQRALEGEGVEGEGVEGEGVVDPEDFGDPLTAESIVGVQPEA